MGQKYVVPQLLNGKPKRRYAIMLLNVSKKCRLLLFVLLGLFLLSGCGKNLFNIEDLLEGKKAKLKPVDIFPEMGIGATFTPDDSTAEITIFYKSETPTTLRTAWAKTEFVIDDSVDVHYKIGANFYDDIPIDSTSKWQTVTLINNDLEPETEYVLIVGALKHPIIIGTDSGEQSDYLLQYFAAAGIRESRSPIAVAKNIQ